MENGYIYRKTTQQFFDPQAGRFLPDRYVEGTCPHCGYENARGDQCDNCGRTLDPDQLIAPRSKLTGATPEMRDTEHFFFKLSAFQQPLLDWLRSRTGWRKHVQNFSIGFVEEGLHDRAITRDIDWGVPSRSRISAPASASTSGSKPSSAISPHPKSGRSAKATRRRGAPGGKSRTPARTTSSARTTSPSTRSSGRRSSWATAASTCRPTSRRTSTSHSRARRRRRARPSETPRCRTSSATSRTPSATRLPPTCRRPPTPT